jgi:hypothetical protein
MENVVGETPNCVIPRKTDVLSECVEPEKQCFGPFTIEN